MGQKETDRRRFDTRVIRAPEPVEPVPLVQDPGYRYYLQQRRRALHMELAAIDKVLGPDEEQAA